MWRGWKPGPRARVRERERKVGRVGGRQSEVERGGGGVSGWVCVCIESERESERAREVCVCIETGAKAGFLAVGWV